MWCRKVREGEAFTEVPSWLSHVAADWKVRAPGWCAVGAVRVKVSRKSLLGFSTLLRTGKSALRAGERVGCGLGADEQVVEAVERGVGVLYLGEEVVHLLDGVFGLVRARGRGRDACPTARRRDARATARRRDACATAVADGLEGGGDVADVAPGEGFDAEIKEAVEFVERDAELEGDPGSGQASGAMRFSMKLRRAPCMTSYLLWSEVATISSGTPKAAQISARENLRFSRNLRSAEERVGLTISVAPQSKMERSAAPARLLRCRCVEAICSRWSSLS